VTIFVICLGKATFVFLCNVIRVMDAKSMVILYNFFNSYLLVICNMNAFFTFDIFMVYIPECKQQLRTMK